MRGFGDRRGLRPTKAENGREAATGGLAEVSDGRREARPCVVRDLSWKPTRYLDPQVFQEILAATLSGRHGRSREEERLAR